MANGAKSSCFALSERQREALTGYLFILPLFLGAAVLFFYPILRSFELSFMQTGVFKGETFVGLKHYRHLMDDPKMWQAMVNSMIYALVGLLEVPLAIFFASLLNTPGLRFLSFYRVLFFLPVVTMPTAVGMVWQLLYNVDYGPINQGLALAGFPPVSWLTQPVIVIVAVAAVGIWSGLGQSIILILSGLQTVPPDLHEAAEMDGAGPLQRFFRITLPMISPTIFLVAVLNVIKSLQVFDLIYIMVGPKNPVFDQAQTIVTYFFEVGFVEHDRGYAAAIVISLLAMIMMVTGLQFYLQKKWVHYG
ncbi:MULTISPECIES: carbohydrate ABC transporter permease [Mesorhizobium]|uniref:carbohydrate ABC transporter permease n=1 Tax=Mesorhizobium TaxID=68287 RepID=UPI0018F7BF02|nr:MULTISPECIES: sugar ABC transporter permease [Mesorhizobium]